MIFIRILLLNVALSVFSVNAKTIPNVYVKVASDKSVPADILYAIALAESGYKYGSIYNPWPWTLNIEGKAYRFMNYQATLEKLEDAISQNKIVDAGVMQINWRWHKDKFSSVSAILNPYNNVQTGANILLEQYRRSKDWWVAVGRYHAPGKDLKSYKRAERYRKRVRKHWRLIKSRSGNKNIQI